MTDELNPYQANATPVDRLTSSPSPEGPRFQTATELLALAQAQKWAINVVGLNYVLNFVCNIILRGTGGDSPLTELGVHAVVAIVWLLGLVVALAGLMHLTRLAFNSWLIAVLVAATAFIPCLAIIAILLVNQQASKILTAAGYRSDITGVLKIHMDRLKADAEAERVDHRNS